MYAAMGKNIRQITFKSAVGSLAQWKYMCCHKTTEQPNNLPIQQ